MVSQVDVDRTLALALGELAPAWKIIGDCAPVDPFDPGQWDSGSQSVLLTLRHRVTGHLKVLGRRVASEPNASPHRAVAFSLIEAFRRGNPEPIRRYLEEIGVAAITSADAMAFFHRPALVSSPAASSRAVTDVAAHGAAATASPDVGTMVSDEIAGGQPVTVGSRGRMLRRLRRELAIWQWRRSTPSADLGSTRTRKD
jgi:hypothetical protein